MVAVAAFTDVGVEEVGGGPVVGETVTGTVVVGTGTGFRVVAVGKVVATVGFAVVVPATVVSA